MCWLFDAPHLDWPCAWHVGRHLKKRTGRWLSGQRQQSWFQIFQLELAKAELEDRVLRQSLASQAFASLPSCRCMSGWSWRWLPAMQSKYELDWTPGTILCNWYQQTKKLNACLWWFKASPKNKRHSSVIWESYAAILSVHDADSWSETCSHASWSGRDDLVSVGGAGLRAALVGEPWSAWLAAAVASYPEKLLFCCSRPVLPGSPLWSFHLPFDNSFGNTWDTGGLLFLWFCQAKTLDPARRYNYVLLKTHQNLWNFIAQWNTLTTGRKVFARHVNHVFLCSQEGATKILLSLPSLVPPLILPLC